MYVGKVYFGKGSKYTEVIECESIKKASKIFNAHVDDRFSVGEVIQRGGEVRRELWRCREVM